MVFLVFASLVGEHWAGPEDAEISKYDDVLSLHFINFNSLFLQIYLIRILLTCYDFGKRTNFNTSDSWKKNQLHCEASCLTSTVFSLGLLIDRKK